mmetsp:Transcript_60287/g.111818  ORF Transcript_60287/g.111818 Transcript_60287/m.111818 type:complete len:215 (+) Transcript_60287:104-748(+)
MGNECACCAPTDPEEGKIETAGARGQHAVVEPTPAPQSTPMRDEPPPRETTAFDSLAQDLDGTEAVAYGEYFQTCSRSGTCGTDNAMMRRFLIDNTSILEDDLDIELIKVAPELQVDKAAFLALIRANAVAESEAIEQFLQMAGEGTSVPAEEARSRLLLFSQDKFRASFNDAQWQIMFDKVMSDAGAQVSMEQWVRYCTDLARMVRLAIYKRL